MAIEPDDLALSQDWPEIVRRVRAQTPARLLAGRAGAAYRTNTQLELRNAHAAARDAVRAELDLKKDFAQPFLERWKLFAVSTQARDKDEYLLRPDLGRCFCEDAREELARRLWTGSDLQIAIGDGLSVTAVVKQAPPLLELLYKYARDRGWESGPPFVIRHCRVGILNEIGELLAPQVVVLLIGERPGLATAESLSAYLAFQPRKGHTDANRNLISNIHSRGVETQPAATRITNLVEKMLKQRTSGYQLREELPSSSDGLGHNLINHTS
jgi:ethanolamine ammonia-lyase small subunit